MEEMSGVGLFIDFEGGEKAGKSTQLKRAAEYLRSLGIKVAETREPGGGDIHIREKLLDAKNKNLTAADELDLFCEDRRLHVQNVILPALARNETVLCDRFEPSSIAYQGYGRGLNLNLIKSKSAKSRQGVWPDLIFLLDGDPEKLLLREALATRFDQESLDFHRRVRNGFLEMASADPDTYVVVNAELPREDVWREVKEQIDRLFE